MSSLTFGENDLLEYNSRHKILICRKCQYAIQKNAIDSHLLRHKIYRGERQSLLSAINQLDLLEPENVSLPDPNESAIGSLPVLSGFCCAASGCSHLTASSKRMRRHWSESHGLDGSIPFSSSLARKVKLQTFFRGTKVRYFEVSASASLSVPAYDENESSANDDLEMPDEDVQKAGFADTPLPSQRETMPSDSSGTLDPADFNLETLFYFHQFMTMTSRTLPTPVPPEYVKNYWQMLAIPAALQWHWLMCGLLAVTAHHSAVLAEDSAIKQLHQTRMNQFAHRFDTGFEQMTARAFNPEFGMVETDAQQVARQFKCLLECKRWTLPVLTFVGELGVSTPLHLVLSYVRGCEIPELSPHHLTTGFDISHSGSHEQMFATNDMYTGTLSSVHESQGNDRGKTPSMIFSRLQLLPSRIAERTERPDTRDDVLAILTATRTLLKCCNIGFESDETSYVWCGVVSWLTNVSEHFTHMVSQQHPAALTLVAHWAAILVNRAAKRGCWFLRGLFKEVMLQVTKEFSRGHCTLIDLVVDLADVMED